MTSRPIATVDDYRAAWERERAALYPAVAAFEGRMGFEVPRGALEGAARVLACPLKAHPPNWQHGRVIYAATRHYLAVARGALEPPVVCLDIGTAKGFSALCLQWALLDAGVVGHVTSVDVLDPAAAVRRNTVVELDGWLTLAQTLMPWPEADAITFVCGTGQDVLEASTDRIHVAFVDGKHSRSAVEAEARQLARRQRPGDLVIFDDVQIEGVAAGVAGAAAAYAFEYLEVLPTRRYALGIRRG